MSKLKYRILIVSMAAFVIAYMMTVYVRFLERWERGLAGNNPLHSHDVDLKNRGLFVWDVPKGTWTYQDGPAKLSLLLDKRLILKDPLHRSLVDLSVRIVAYTVRQNGERIDRLIRDWYYKTDHPFSPEGHSMWQSNGEMLEYGLGLVSIVPNEPLIIELEVKTPDMNLGVAHPRLVLVGDHDSAGLPVARAFVTIGNTAGLFLSLVCVSVLAALAFWVSNGATEKKFLKDHN